MKISLTNEAVRHTIETEGLTFVLRPQVLKDRVVAMTILEGLDIDTSNLRAGAMVILDVMTAMSIVEWEAVEIEGKPAECNQENKLMLASQFPHILASIRSQYEAQLASAEGNSEPMPDGSETRDEPESAETVLNGR